ncbi:hypothetical protein E2C01_045623 [Portunus trituberculatus]|uniref:Uncharacterized protein n=1 Tax=Portunus trituberculatus TaxID=210409 RepID=A0A5B7FVM1_PORTR|nr:hypothetical protein [Portunus trituberculatus]
MQCNFNKSLLNVVAMRRRISSEHGCRWQGGIKPHTPSLSLRYRSLQHANPPRGTCVQLGRVLAMG